MYDRMRMDQIFRKSAFVTWKISRTVLEWSRNIPLNMLYFILTPRCTSGFCSATSTELLMSLMMLIQSCCRLLGASSTPQSSSLASCTCVFREEHVCLAAGKVVDFDNQSGSSKKGASGKQAHPNRPTESRGSS